MTDDKKEIQEFEEWWRQQNNDTSWMGIDKWLVKVAWLERGRRVEKKVEGFEKLIKALQHIGAAYKTGTNPPEWVFDTIDQARKDGLI